MNPALAIQCPLRRPQWRLDRAIQLISARPTALRPGAYDDPYVRLYRRKLLELTAAGADEAKRDAVFFESPDVCHAHQLHYSPDIERRQILEARLLTSETFEEIAGRFAATPKAIEFYEALFFNVRDRLECSDWIRKIIIGSRDEYRGNKTGRMTEAERGYLYRLFAYFGGPLVLDAVVSGMVRTSLPRRPEDVEGWFNDAFKQLVQTSAAAAAATLRLNQKNLLQMMKLALRGNKANSSTPDTASGTEYGQRVMEMFANVESSLAEGTLPGLDEIEKK